jgi:CheY-like chemotaxis protein
MVQNLQLFWNKQMTNDYIADIYKTLNILCVEDDPDVLETYKSLFSLIFKEVYFAKNGKEGFECFNKHQIDIILTDYMMPEWTGLDLARAVRKEDASIPIVMVTALESIEMLREAIDLQITSFLKKPFTSSSLFRVFSVAVKSVIVDRCILKEQHEKISYSHYQENLSFNKEKTIIQNDVEKDKRLLHFLCNVFYKPKDILSGDSYSIRKISTNEYLVFVVDGMGKGIAASLTAMLCSAFVNYFVTTHIKQNNNRFSLRTLLEELLHFIQPTLAEYEVISATFLYFNNTKDTLQYAIFSMPPPLYILNNAPTTVHKIKSNNPPLNAYADDFMINEQRLCDIHKMLIYSDGLNECNLSEANELYTLYIKEDFTKADDMQEFHTLFLQKCDKQEDDITYIFLKEVQKDRS